MAECSTSKELPPAKRRCSYILCKHCNKELSIKIYKEHKRLYYDQSNNTWTMTDDNVQQCSSSDFASMDEFELLLNSEQEIPVHMDSDTDFGFDDCEDYPSDGNNPLHPAAEHCDDSFTRYIICRL